METRVSCLVFYAVSTLVHSVTIPVLFFLAFVEKILPKCEHEEELEENPDQRFNFALAFSNGQRQGNAIFYGMRTQARKIWYYFNEIIRLCV